jgi:hypothetical protein
MIQKPQNSKDRSSSAVSKSQQVKSPRKLGPPSTQIDERQQSPLTRKSLNAKIVIDVVLRNKVNSPYITSRSGIKTTTVGSNSLKSPTKATSSKLQEKDITAETENSSQILSTL